MTYTLAHLILFQVDITALKEAKGFLFHRDHLQILGMPNHRSWGTDWSIGDEVTTSLELDAIMQLQVGHGEWKNEMLEVQLL